MTRPAAGHKQAIAADPSPHPLRDSIDRSARDYAHGHSITPGPRRRPTGRTDHGAVENERMRTRPEGLLLAPGAGSGSDQPALLAVDLAVSGLGMAVERIDFPYRLAGRRRPDSPAVLEATVTEAARAMTARLEAAGRGTTGGAGGRVAVGTARLALGGRSMGGRICSQVAAAGLPVAALVLISYPLHPPGRPDRPRTEHLSRLDVPCLFLSGTRDAFGTPEELETATARIPGPVTHVWIEGGDHGLRRRDEEVAGAVARWLGALRSGSEAEN